MWAVDGDTQPDSLIFTVLGNDSDAGYVERVPLAGGFNGQPVHTFTQAELARGSIDYVHSGKSKMSAHVCFAPPQRDCSSSSSSTAKGFYRGREFFSPIMQTQDTGEVWLKLFFTIFREKNLFRTITFETCEIVNYFWGSMGDTAFFLGGPSIFLKG